MDEIHLPESDLWMHRRDRDIFLNYLRDRPDTYALDEWDLNDEVGRLMDSALEFTITHNNWVGHVALHDDEWVLYVKDEERNDGLLNMDEAFEWIQDDPCEAPNG
jgi:hypothetical protein